MIHIIEIFLNSTQIDMNVNKTKASKKKKNNQKKRKKKPKKPLIS